MTSELRQTPKCQRGSLIGMDERRAAVAAAGVTVVLWASAFVGIRAAAPYFAPGSLALGRLLSGAIVLVLFLLLRGERFPPRAAWSGIVLSGVLWFGVYMVLLNWGEREVDAGTAAMVVNVGPIVMALLAGWLLREGFPPRLLAGLAVHPQMSGDRRDRPPLRA